MTDIPQNEVASAEEAAPMHAAVERRALAEFWFYFSENRGAVIGLVVFLALILVALLAPVIAPYGPNVQDRNALLVPPARTAFQSPSASRASFTGYQSA